MYLHYRGDQNDQFVIFDRYITDVEQYIFKQKILMIFL